MKNRITILLSAALIALGAACTSTGQDQPIKPQPERPWLYDSITFEFVAVKGAEPSKEALAEFKSKIIQHRICRPKYIVFVVRPPVESVPDIPIWTAMLIQQFEQHTRTLWDIDPWDRHLVIFVPYFKGLYYDGQMRTLGGIQYSPSTFALWPRNSPKQCEGSVLLPLVETHSSVLVFRLVERRVFCCQW